MAKGRQNKIDTVAGAVEVAQMAVIALSPPPEVPLDPKDLPFFDAVIAEFARSEWTAHQLQLAANLARMMADMTRELALLREEGVVAYSEKGTPVINPRKTAAQMYASTILSMRRSLSLHARAQKGEARDVGKRRDQVKGVEGDVEGDDDLLHGAPIH